MSFIDGERYLVSTRKAHPEIMSRQGNKLPNKTQLKIVITLYTLIILNLLQSN